MKRLLVTGARGFIGRHCLAPALAAGYEVIAVSSGASSLAPDLAELPVEWRQANLLAPGVIEDLLAEIRPTHVLHTAWETSHGSYWTSPANLDWLALGARFFRSFAENGGQRFVAAGTCAEYDWQHGYMVEGVTPEQPATFYGRIKLAHHHALMAAAEQLGFSAATGRVFFAYGPHENAARILPYACQQLGRGEPADFASGQFMRDFMHVEDVASGFITLLANSIAGACNVSSGQPSMLADLVTNLGTISGSPQLIRLGTRPDRPDDPPMLVGDNAKLRGAGWKPRISIEAGLRDTYAFWESAGGAVSPSGGARRSKNST